MSPRAYTIIGYVLSVVKVLLAIFMMIAGISTMFMPLPTEPIGLGFIYSSRISLVIFGTAFFCSGLTLFLGKLLRKKVWVGRGLMAIYLCFMFAAILNGIALDWAVKSWSPNALGALITGGLWLWWKFKTEYINVNYFQKQARTIRVYRRGSEP